MWSAYFNPRSPDGERLDGKLVFGSTEEISIHAPRMGSDWLDIIIDARLEVISIHAPRMGSDRQRAGTIEGIADFNPRSPDGERHLVCG